MLRCADDTLYTGITTDLERRIVAHNDPKKGAKYTRARQPVALVYQEKAESRSAALKREAAIKKLSREEKTNLVLSYKTNSR
jgi:putative endonuclease